MDVDKLQKRQKKIKNRIIELEREYDKIEREKDLLIARNAKWEYKVPEGMSDYPLYHTRIGND